MDLTCYVHPGWAPLIRPAPSTRGWMDATPEAFAYRCLPLNIANSHGWEILCPCSFEAFWNGAIDTGAVTLRVPAEVPKERAPVTIFGQGVLTFHVEAIFRTPPGWNLWVGGSPNRLKDGIQALTGVIETDWAPFTFTLNWRFTRPDHWVRFEAFEPIGFVFPVQRDALEQFEPRFVPSSEDPETLRRFQEWSRARNAFHEKMYREPPATPADKWQKHYYRGVDVAGEALISDHRAKLRLKPFDRTATPNVPEAPLSDPQGGAPPPSSDPATLALRKREWLLETMERQRALAPAAVGIERRSGLSSEDFLERYYATSRPVILTGEMDDWPAVKTWTPERLEELVGDRDVEFQVGRSANPRFEIDKERHRRIAPFPEFMRQILQTGAGNDVYMTAFNSAPNQEALKVLQDDMRPLDKYLEPEGHKAGMLWIGPAGTVTSLHHDLTNNLIAQVRGRKRFQLLPSADVGRIYNLEHVFSEIADLNSPDLDLSKYSRLAGAHLYDITLDPGEMIFIPVGWWHQVTALDISVTSTFTNFIWPNDAASTYPVS